MAIPNAPILELRDLSLSLGGIEILRSLSLNIPGGSFTAVIGPNGSGKTSLLKTLLGLYQPGSGDLRLLGHPQGQCPPELIAYVPQAKTQQRGFPAQSLELVASGTRRSWPWRLSAKETAAAQQALEQVGAGILARRSLDTLSGGELQRVYLARALARNPQLVLLDEPATGIDAVGEADMYHILEQYRARSGASILMVTHDWGAAYHHASHVLLLNHELIAFGPPAAALTDENLARAFGHSGHSHGMGWIQSKPGAHSHG
jgi:zinc transport system ATP-binding protein